MVWKGKALVQPAGRGTTTLTWRGTTYLVPTAATATVTGADDLPDLVGRVEITDGAPVVRHLSITSKPDGMPVRDALLDGLSMDKFARWAFLQLAVKHDGGGGLTHVEGDTRDMWSLVAALDDAQKSQRGPSGHLLEQVARIYQSHIDRAPTQAVAEALGLSPRTAARRIKQAEVAGLLPPTSQGKKRGK